MHEADTKVRALNMINEVYFDFYRFSSHLTIFPTLATFRRPSWYVVSSKHCSCPSCLSCRFPPNKVNSRLTVLDSSTPVRIYALLQASAPATLTFPENEVLILRATFQSYDKNTDGLLNTEELLNLLSFLEVHVSDEEAKSAISSFDTDGDGSLNCEEFLSLITVLKNMA